MMFTSEEHINHEKHFNILLRIFSYFFYCRVITKKQQKYLIFLSVEEKLLISMMNNLYTI